MRPLVSKHPENRRPTTIDQNTFVNVLSEFRPRRVCFDVQFVLVFTNTHTQTLHERKQVLSGVPFCRRPFFNAAHTSLVGLERTPPNTVDNSGIHQWWFVTSELKRAGHGCRVNNKLYRSAYSTVQYVCPFCCFWHNSILYV